jgi:hypothetical protein
MSASRLLICAMTLAFAVPVLASTPRQILTPKEIREYRAVSSFLKAVDHYVVTHRLTRTIQPDVMCLPRAHRRRNQ